MEINQLNDTELVKAHMYRSLIKPMVQRRKDLKLSQEALAMAAELNQGNLSSIELGMRTPRAYTLFKMAEVLGLKIVVQDEQGNILK